MGGVESFFCGESDGEDGDVVVLAEGLGGGGYVGGGLRADGGGAVEAEERAGGRCGFDDSVGHESDAVAWCEIDGGLGVCGVSGDAKGKAGVKREFCAVETPETKGLGTRKAWISCYS
jgi:hypothetical protein